MPPRAGLPGTRSVDGDRAATTSASASRISAAREVEAAARARRATPPWVVGARAPDGPGHADRRGQAGVGAVEEEAGADRPGQPVTEDTWGTASATGPKATANRLVDTGQIRSSPRTAWPILRRA